MGVVNIKIASSVSIENGGFKQGRFCIYRVWGLWTVLYLWNMGAVNRYLSVLYLQNTGLRIETSSLSIEYGACEQITTSSVSVECGGCEQIPISSVSTEYRTANRNEFLIYRIWCMWTDNYQFCIRGMWGMWRALTEIQGMLLSKKRLSLVLSVCPTLR